MTDPCPCTWWSEVMDKCLLLTTPTECAGPVISIVHPAYALLEKKHQERLAKRRAQRAARKAGTMNCAECEHGEIKSSVSSMWRVGTNWYGCKFGWKSCEECPWCAANHGRNCTTEDGLCHLCHGRGKVEVKG